MYARSTYNMSFRRIVEIFWNAQESPVLLLVVFHVHSGVHQATAAIRISRSGLENQGVDRTYKPRPSRPENDLLISSSWRACYRARVRLGLQSRGGRRTMTASQLLQQYVGLPSHMRLTWSFVSVYGVAMAQGTRWWSGAR
jgi:hypothetical protein